MTALLCLVWASWSGKKIYKVYDAYDDHAAQSNYKSCRGAKRSHAHAKARRVHNDVRRLTRLPQLSGFCHSLNTGRSFSLSFIISPKSKPCHSLNPNDGKPTLPQTFISPRMTTSSTPRLRHLRRTPNTSRMFSTHPYAHPCPLRAHQCSNCPQAERKGDFDFDDDDGDLTARTAYPPTPQLPPTTRRTWLQRVSVFLLNFTCRTRLTLRHRSYQTRLHAASMFLQY